MHHFSSPTVPRRPALLAGRASGEHRGLGFGLLALAAVLSLALLAGASLTAGAAQASFPGTNGKIACAGPLGPNPPPAGQSFLEVFNINPDGTGQTRLTTNTVFEVDPTYSADGTKLVFIRDNNVWRMNADGTGETQLTTGNTDDRVGGWSPDGSQIVFQRSVEASPGAFNFEIFKMNADGTGQINLTNNPGSATVGSNDSQPSWSPDGTKIAFHSSRLGNSNIHTMNPDGTGVRALTADSLAEESAPEFSPDGQQIAFQGDRNFVPRPGVGRNLEIYRINAADGSNVRRLTFNDYNPAATGGETTSNLTGFDLEPYWSPAGDRIVFHSGRNDAFGAAQWDVFTVGAVNGEDPAFGAPAVQVTNRDFNDFRCSWGVATPFPLLSVSKAGSGEGTVTSSLPGIDCGADCAQGYAPGTMVTLTAAPAAGGSTFAGFTGGGCSGAGTTCAVTVDAAKTVTATFTDANPALTVTKAGSGATGKAGTGSGTVTSAPAGIDCGVDCTEEYASGTPVTLTAAPAVGSTFSGFSGAGCSGTGTTCTVTVDQARTVTATFSGPLLTVMKAGDGASSLASSVTSNPLGITCGVDCSEDYAANTQVTLTGNVSTSTVAGGFGASFAGFSGGGCSGSANTCTVTMDQAKAVTATFIDFPTLTVTKTGTGAGGVTSTPVGLNCGATCTRDFAKDSIVTLTAAPVAGSRFTGFTGGGCSGTATTCAVTIDQAKTVTANFVLTRALTVTKAGAGAGTVTSAPAGIDCGADCTEDYAENAMVTLTAAPAAGANAFAGFSGGGCSGTGTTCTVTMDAAKTVTATFAVTNALSVTKAGAGAGTVTSAPAGINCGADCSESYVSGTSVTLTANPAAGSSFSGFTGAGCSGTGTTCTVTVDQARTVTATFALIPRALTVTKAGNGAGAVTSSPAGINCGSDCVQAYDNGTRVTLTANPAAGSSFSGFTGAPCSGYPVRTCTVTMDQARSVTATFARIPVPPPLPPPFPGCSPLTANVILGSAGADTRTGTTTGDRIFTAAGNDVVDGLAGDDCIDLGPGDDRGQGGAGNDLVLGGLGNDTVTGSEGDDRMRGDAGADSVVGNEGNDDLLGGIGGDRLFGGFGNDRLHGQSGRDSISGSRGRDRINGGAANDAISGGSSADRIAGDQGSDRINGNSSSDVLGGNSGGDRITGGSGRDRISGGAGGDTISARDRTRDQITCGTGRDSVVADRIDRVSRNCERVRRR